VPRRARLGGGDPQRTLPGFRKVDNFGDVWPPYVVKLELVGGCEQRCSFCAVRGDAGDLMSVQTIVAVCDEMRALKWESRIELSVHGDPSHHPALAAAVRLISERTQRMNSISVYTSGVGLRHPLEEIDAIMRAGANCVAVGDYPNAPLGRRLLAGDGGALELLLPGLRVGRWPGDRWANPERRFRVDERVVSVCTSPIRAGTITNQAGAAFPENNSAEGRRCNLPHRELVVRWTGEVLVCDQDVGLELVCGHVSEGLRAVWTGATLRAARARLGAGDRSLRPCRGCDRVLARGETTRAPGPLTPPPAPRL
jgi:hypothetical protein